MVGIGGARRVFLFSDHGVVGMGVKVCFFVCAFSGFRKIGSKDPENPKGLMPRFFKKCRVYLVERLTVRKHGSCSLYSGVF